VPNYADGQWHQVRIPLREMFIDTQNFDRKKPAKSSLALGMKTPISTFTSTTSHSIESSTR
jgi:hypothetical protein